MAQREQANVPLLVTIGAISGVLLIVLGIGLEAWYLRAVQQEATAKWDNVPIQPLTDDRAAQWKNISTYHWVDEKKTKAAIPISEAMKMVVERQGKTAGAKMD